MAGEKSYFGKDDLKPSFLKPKTPSKTPADFAENNLKNLENSAANSTMGNSGKDAKTLESNTSSFYSNQGKVTHFKKSHNKNDSKLFTLLKYSPAILLVMILAVGAFLIFGSQSFLGPHIEALYTEATDTAYTGYNLRAVHMAEEMLEGKIEMTDYMKTRLEKEGIEVVSETNLSFNNKPISADNFKTMYNGDALFREAYDNAIGGRGANFLDAAASNFAKKLGLSKNVFRNYKTTGNNDTDTQNYNELLADYFKNSADATLDSAEEEEGVDEEGNHWWDVFRIGEPASSDAAEGEDSVTKAKAYLHNIGEKVAEETEGCTTLKIGDIVSTAVSSNRFYQAIHEFMTKMETISKAKAGDGDASAINSVLNWFTTPATTTVYDPYTEEEYTITGSPLESEGARVVLGKVSADSSKTPKYSLERSYKATDKVAFSMGIGNTCTVKRAGGVVLSILASAVPGSKLLSSTVGVLLDTAFKLGVKVVAEAVLNLLVPTVAKIMYENPFVNAVGIAGGEGFTMGAANVNMLMGRQTSGASVASREQVLAYNQETEELIARDAEIDRLHHGPFDASSKNTFFGSIVSSLLPLSSISAGLTSSLTTLSNIANTSLATLNSAYAAGENSSLMTSFGDCDKTEEIGASGNFYCSAISTIDLSTLDTATDDSEYQKVISESIETGENGEETVIEGSPLADYITYHMGRYSAPGIRDANIAQACKEKSSFLPHLTSITDMIKAFFGSEDAEYCESVADGSRYVDSPDNPYWETEKWHQLWVLTWRVKCHMGLCSNDGGPVVAYQDKYDATHPLDNSRAGYLARISGLEKSEAENVIAVADYLNKIDSYEPEMAYKFGENNKETAGSIMNPSHLITDETIALRSNPITTVLIRREETTA